MKNLVSILACLIFTSLPALAEHPNADAARAQAKKLLAHYSDGDERASVEKEVKVLAPMKNPSGDGTFEVLEVWGFVYKGQYRMRFYYAKVDGEYLLMGEEIVELAKL